ncbi:hypothetical protein A3E96_02070 [Candidatus Uhrbacteria bacterium RIFCSPHIGHO2_12_FULL_46_13]|nr:MAG: hypothetical protein A3D60_00850 [Candidatus Uhrbacteria bacterium RIFCSPHIGHO2_02_FULL_47_29]OGL75998.1 MAG: hypothetical protein A3E96_02070 [Candidatus Uhrbacteria bacterium RIFCSPHIGHO2_12_FULL_46_13]
MPYHNKKIIVVMPAYNAEKTPLQDDHKIHTQRTSPAPIRHGRMVRDGAGFPALPAGRRSPNLCGGLDHKVEELHLCVYPRVCQIGFIHSFYPVAFL